MHKQASNKPSLLGVFKNTGLSGFMHKRSVIAKLHEPGSGADTGGVPGESGGRAAAGTPAAVTAAIACTRL